MFVALCHKWWEIQPRLLLTTVSTTLNDCNAQLHHILLFSGARGVNLHEDRPMAKR